MRFGILLCLLDLVPMNSILPTDHGLLFQPLFIFLRLFRSGLSVFSTIMKQKQWGFRIDVPSFSCPKWKSKFICQEGCLKFWKSTSKCFVKWMSGRSLVESSSTVFFTPWSNSKEGTGGSKGNCSTQPFEQSNHWIKSRFLWQKFISKVNQNSKADSL